MESASLPGDIKNLLTGGPTTNRLLQQLLDRMKLSLDEEKLGNLFAVGLERDRMISALYNAGLGIPFVYVDNTTVAPGATVTVNFALPPGYVAVLQATRLDVSLPWYMAYAGFHDTPATGTPTYANLAMPPLIVIDFPYIWPIFGYGIDVWTNNHPSLSNNGHQTVTSLIMRADVWKMVKSVYLDPVVDYIKKKAAEISGVPPR